MGQTLENSIYLPDEGETNCYSGLASNWRALDTLKGSYSLHAINVDIHVTAAEKETWNGKADASALTAHTGDTTIHVTAEDKQAWDNHVADTVKHVTAEDKAKWDAVTSKADDSAVVHKSGGETISGIKTFSSRAVFSTTSKDGELTLRQNAYDPATNGQSALSSTCGFTVTARTVTNGSFAQIGFYGASGFTTTRLNCRYYTGAGESEESWVEYTVVGTSGSITGRSFKPSNNGRIDLGTNTNRWKSVYSTSINGLEPSSLSLPSGNANDVIDISSYITDFSGTANTYTAPANGWVAISMNNCMGIQAYISGFFGDSRTRPTTGTIKFLMPICKNQTINLQIYGGTLENARFIPCQGNV